MCQNHRETTITWSTMVAFFLHNKVCQHQAKSSARVCCSNNWWHAYISEYVHAYMHTQTNATFQCFAAALMKAEKRLSQGRLQISRIKCLKGMRGWAQPSQHAFTLPLFLFIQSCIYVLTNHPTKMSLPFFSGEVSGTRTRECSSSCCCSLCKKLQGPSTWQ